MRKIQAIERAARRGDSDAQVDLGLLYMTGDGGSIKDDESAVHWFRRASQQDSPSGYFYLGKMYQEGRGVPQDHDQASRLYHEAIAASSRLPSRCSVRELT